MTSLQHKYRALIFDLDGTLIDSLPLHVLAFKDLLLERNIRIEEEHMRRIIGLPTKKILAELKRRYALKENVNDLYEERRYHYFKFLGRKNIVFPGAMKALEDLRFDYMLAIATGSSKSTAIHSTNRDFQELFDAIITINDVKKGKPFPEELLLVSKKLRVPPQRCLMVGDSVYDALAAKRAKMDFIGVTTGYTSAKTLREAGAKAILSKVKDLVPELKKIEA